MAHDGGVPSEDGTSIRYTIKWDTTPILQFNEEAQRLVTRALTSVHEARERNARNRVLHYAVSCPKCGPKGIALSPVASLCGGHREPLALRNKTVWAPSRGGSMKEAMWDLADVGYKGQENFKKLAKSITDVMLTGAAFSGLQSTRETMERAGLAERKSTAQFLRRYSKTMEGMKTRTIEEMKADILALGRIPALTLTPQSNGQYQAVPAGHMSDGTPFWYGSDAGKMWHVEAGEIYGNDAGQRFLVTLVHKKDLMVAYESLPYDGSSGSAGGPNSAYRFLHETCGPGMRLIGKMQFNGAHRAYRKERLRHAKTQARIDKALEALEIDSDEVHGEVAFDAITNAISALRPT